MEEILASIRRIIEDGNPVKDDESAEDQAEPVMSTAEVAEFSREFADADVFAKPAPRPDHEAVKEQAAEAKPEPIRFPTFDYSPETKAAPESAAIANIPQPFAELRPIISEAAGRQVARSFEHLSVALNEERGTSVAQMTEDMVRPMLQDWLDNNLPTLVERLVREEIERVARGAR
jgi:uncharacterized protein